LTTLSAPTPAPPNLSAVVERAAGLGAAASCKTVSRSDIDISGFFLLGWLAGRSVPAA
jgi:hypothetical protein